VTRTSYENVTRFCIHLALHPEACAIYEQGVDRACPTRRRLHFALLHPPSVAPYSEKAVGMDLPGHYEPSSSSENDDSDASFSPALMDHLEAVAQLSDSQDEQEQDPDWQPRADGQDEDLDQMDHDDFDDDDDDEDEDADPRETTGAGAGAGAGEGRGALQIGYDRQFPHVNSKLPG
jgi:hypothetical protein